MRSRCRRRFRPPLVITVAMGCSGGGRVEPKHLTTEPPVVQAAPHDASPRGPRPGDVIFDDPACYRVAADAGLEATACPDELLPEPPADRLIRGEGHDRVWCLVIVDDGEGARVRCPDGGPTVAVPEDRGFERKGERMEIDADTLRCGRYVMANPPYLTPIDRCPRALLPRLIGGARPTREDRDGCWWNQIEVQCDPPRPDDAVASELRGAIVAIEPWGKGSRITLAIGTDDGATAEWRGAIAGLGGKGEVTISSCDRRSCKATTPASPKQVRASSMMVVIRPQRAR